MRDTFIEELTREAKINDRVMLITGDLGFGVLIDYSKQFPKQFLNAGIAEQNMTGLACGLALSGRKVFTYSIGNFPTLRCLEQIRNDVCYHNADVKMVAIGGGFSYGSLGMSHHATEDLSIMRAIPNIMLVAPGCLWETREATKQLLKHHGPAYLRIDKSNAGNTAGQNESFELGKIRTVRDGEDITLATSGGILGSVLEAASILSTKGISARVLSVHTLKPLDHKTLHNAARETKGIISIEENNILGGLGGAIAESCLEGGAVPGFFRRIGLKDHFSSTVGSQFYLRDHYSLGTSAVVNTAVQLFQDKNHFFS